MVLKDKLEIQEKIFKN